MVAQSHWLIHLTAFVSLLNTQIPNRARANFLDCEVRTPYLATKCTLNTDEFMSAFPFEMTFTLHYLYDCNGHQTHYLVASELGGIPLTRSPLPQSAGPLNGKSLKFVDLSPGVTSKGIFSPQCQLKVLSTEVDLSQKEIEFFSERLDALRSMLTGLVNLRNVATYAELIGPTIQSIDLESANNLLAQIVDDLDFTLRSYEPKSLENERYETLKLFKDRVLDLIALEPAFAGNNFDRISRIQDLLNSFIQEIHDFHQHSAQTVAASYSYLLKKVEFASPQTQLRLVNQMDEVRTLLAKLGWAHDSRP